MKRSTLIFLLTCSVLFNLFFIAGAMVWNSEDASRPRVRSHAAAINRIVSEMGLDSRQQAAFEALRREYEEESGLLTARMQDVRNQMSMELRKEDPDPSVLAALTERENALRNESHRAGSLRFEEFLEYLTPEQRRIIGQRLEEHQSRRHHGPGGRMLDRFDLNGNGVIDPEERNTADAKSEEWKRRHGERRRNREEARARFDVDGDGKLSAEERDALHEWRLQQGRPGRPEGGDPPPAPKQDPDAP
ncbi:MAG: periplasmic heavy metal sensor [Phycisphaerales bacterium]|nr:periplasmic heavy metal sensor [Phycisphaerales bacterium]